MPKPTATPPPAPPRDLVAEAVDAWVTETFSNRPDVPVALWNHIQERKALLHRRLSAAKE